MIWLCSHPGGFEVYSADTTEAYGGIMEALVPVLQVIGGLVLLYFGGNFLVGGATGIAAKLRISPVVIGLTVVAFGTSAPELFVSVAAALGGKPDIALGNVIGSNVVNILLILGITALFMTVPVSKSILRRDLPAMLVASILLPLALLNFGGANLLAGGVIEIWEGIVLLLLLIGYVILLVRTRAYGEAEAEPDKEVVELAEKEQARPVLLLLGMVGLGIAGLAFGADFLVDGASWLAINLFNVSERVVGITIVAFGTSLPELVTSVVAMAKKEADISVGNIVGSNIFNILFVLGLASVFHPIAADVTSYGIDLILMVGIAVVLAAVCAVLKKIPRAWGVLFIAGYVGYLAYLFQSQGV